MFEKAVINKLIAAVNITAGVGVNRFESIIENIIGKLESLEQA
jgi:hypothetical protein